MASTPRKLKARVARLPRSIRRLFPDVTECFDSDRAADVHVTSVDIKRSDPLHPSKCAMAHAFKRETHADGAIIGLAYSYLIKGKTAFRFKTPTAVQREIVSFDRHHDFAAGHYYLVPPSPAKRLGTYTPRSSGKSGKHQQRIIHRTSRVRVLEGKDVGRDILVNEERESNPNAGGRLVKR